MIHLVLLAFAFTSVMPFVWMFFGSFKSYVELTSGESLVPQVWTLDNYRTIIFRANFPKAFWNSAVVSLVVSGCVVLTSAAAAYVFAKYRFWGKEQLFIVILSTMMVPFAVVLVPLYVTIADIGLYNKLGGVIVPVLFSTFGIFLMRQFLEGIPSDLIDAGRIDGASEWWIFSRIIIPLSTAPMAALAVFTFLFNWDNFLWPSVVLTSPQSQTLPLVLAGLRSLYLDRYEMWSAGSMLTVAPVMLLYAVAQKQFIRGITMTGLKA
ncbi:MAG: carbohydrate ABC transporter permease [Caldilineaceae bacterium]|nr:carbohydrate ABC transporter permease [Caldilineaceae bacterium]